VELQRQFPQREIGAAPALLGYRDFQAAVPARPAAQGSLSQTVGTPRQALAGFCHLRGRMGFQTQLLSDKGFYENLGSVLFVFFGRKNEINRIPGAAQSPL
jgi:hypothetical protein